MSWRRLTSSSRAGASPRGIEAHRKRLWAATILPATLIAFALPVGTAVAAQPFAFGSTEEVPLAGGIAPLALSQPYLNLSVSCSAPGECAAAGRYYDTTTSSTDAIVVTETNGTWRAAAHVKLPQNAASNPSFAYLDAISCAPGGTCVAVGAYEEESGEYVPMTASEAGGSWSAAKEIELPAGALTSGQDADLADVSCTASGSCTAVGWYYSTSSTDYRAMAVNETDGSWAQATEVEQPSNLAGEPNGWLESLSCISAETCTAVGWYRDSSEHFEAMATEETEGAWTRASEIELPFEASQALRLAPSLRYEGVYFGNLNVACTSAASCSAAGFSDNHPLFPPEEYEALLATKAAGHWSATQVAQLPADAATSGQEALIYQLACAASGTCVAGGTYKTTEGNEPMTVAESGGTWQQASKLALPSNADTTEQYASIESIACPSAGSCIAAGYYKESEGQYQAMIASQSAGTWEAAQEVTLPATAAVSPQEAWLSSISCATATSCSSVGVFETGTPAFQLMGLNAAATLSVSTASLPAAEVGKPYEAKLSTAGGAGADSWSLASGALPAGLTLNASTGVVSGTPTSAGAAAFAVKVSNAGPPVQGSTASLSIVVAAAPPNVVLPPKQPAKPRIIVASSKLSERKGKAKVKLICKRAACEGTVKLFEVVAKKVERRTKGKAKGKAKARIEHIRVLLGKGHYSIDKGKTEIVALKLTGKAKELLAKAAVRKHAKLVHAKPVHAKPVHAKLEVRLRNGKSQTRNVVLVAAHHNRQRGHKHRTHKR